MKCPKCGYLGFEHVERCRNCGYEFSLNRSAEPPDLTIRPSSAQTAQPLADLSLDIGTRPGGTAAVQELVASMESRSGTTTLGPTPELPLFGTSPGDDAPLITRPSPPRTPLAVRRATPEVPRLRSESRVPTLDLTPADPDAPPHPQPSVVERPVPRDRRARARIEIRVAPAILRIAATTLDLAVLAAIDAIVVYFTLQICGLAFREAMDLPRAPLLAFLALQNVSYLIVFTAAGQTLGQMVLGVKVVPLDDAGAPPGFRSAFVRTAVFVLLAAPAGLGLLSVALSRDRRGLHDRAAGTGVIRVAA